MRLKCPKSSVNNYTNIWDVAAGEILVRAIGGKVTNFKGQDISYTKGTKIDIVASSTKDLHSEILKIVSE